MQNNGIGRDYGSIYQQYQRAEVYIGVAAAEQLGQNIDTPGRRAEIVYAAEAGALYDAADYCAKHRIAGQRDAGQGKDIDENRAQRHADK